MGLLNSSGYELETLQTVKTLKQNIYMNSKTLELALMAPHPHESALTVAIYYHDRIIPIMEAIRKDVDELELITDRGYWPMPTYKELLFGVD